MLLEIIEETSSEGCSWLDRRTFRLRTIAGLKEEFGERLTVKWDEPQGAAARSLPTIILDARVIHRGGYLPWEVLRPVVGHALAVEDAVADCEREAAELALREGLLACDWQEGLLEWIGRHEDGR